MNFSSRHTVSQSIKRKTRFWRATSKAQDTNSKCYISIGYNMAKSKWLFRDQQKGSLLALEIRTALHKGEKHTGH